MVVLIKTALTATNLRLDKDDHRIDINCGGDLKVIVTVERAESEGDCICSARLNAMLPAELAADFTGNDPSPRLYDYLRAAGAPLNNYLIRTIRLLMWRRGMRVDYSLSPYRTMFWSMDGEQWKPLPVRITGFVGHVGIPWRQGPVPSEVIADVSTLVERGDDEPLAHQLMREAWVQKNASPRSALVIALTAAEVGFKHCVSNLVPDSKWLVENLQSPPLYKMLTEYLPLLPVRLRLKGKTLVPPEELLHEIRTGNNLRNEVVHQGHVKIAPEKLDRILKAVSDLLWILDVYQGREWAIKNVQVRNTWKSDGAKS